VGAVLGIDVGKANFHCALLIDGQSRSNSFSNSLTGFGKLLGWLRNRDVAHVHACLEVDGRNLSSGLRPVLAKTLCAVTLRFHRTVG